MVGSQPQVVIAAAAGGGDPADLRRSPRKAWISTLRVKMTTEAQTKTGAVRRP